jgi:signal transduction histidine kinase
MISEYLYHNLTRDGERELADMQERAQLIGRKIVVDFASDRGYTVTVEVPV